MFARHLLRRSEDDVTSCHKSSLDRPSVRIARDKRPYISFSGVTNTELAAEAILSDMPVLPQQVTKQH